jgi:cell division protein FtsL
VACLHCNSENLPGQKFCGECGQPIQDSVLNTGMVVAIDARIRNAIEKQLQDQSTLEIKTAQAVVTRITDWGKLFGLITAVPLTILLATLGIWGVTSFLDFRKKVDSGKAQISEDIKNARDDIQNARNDTVKLKAEVDAAHAELGSLPSDVKNLQSKVATLEEKIGFVPTPSLTPQLKTKLKSALDGFQTYCRSIGFHPKAGEVHLRIEKDLEKKMSTDAYYDPDKSEMIVDASKAGDPSFALREYMHRTLYTKDLLKGPQPNRPPAQSPSAEWYAIESGLASYFPASFLNSSHTGFSDLSQIEQLPARRSDLGEAVGWGIRVWGSAFWELRNTIGQENCDKLLVRFWNSLDPNDKGPYTSDALSRLLDLYRDTGGKDTAAVKAIFSRRGVS